MEKTSFTQEGDGGKDKCSKGIKFKRQKPAPGSTHLAEAKTWTQTATGGLPRSSQQHPQGPPGGLFPEGPVQILGH